MKKNIRGLILLNIKFDLLIVKYIIGVGIIVEKDLEDKWIPLWR